MNIHIQKVVKVRYKFKISNLSRCKQKPNEHQIQQEGRRGWTKGGQTTRWNFDKWARNCFCVCREPKKERSVNCELLKERVQEDVG